MTKKNHDKNDKYWKFAGSPWKSQAMWWSWIRSSLRRGSNRHPAKIAKLNAERIKIPNPNPASAKRFPEVWGAQCACCSGIFPLSGGKKEGKQKTTIQVDHKIESGSLKDQSDLQRFVERMYCVSPDDLELLCSVCNKTKDLSVKLGVSFKEAECERDAIAIVKEKSDKSWLLDRNILPASAQANRRKQIVEQLKKERGIETI